MPNKYVFIDFTEGQRRDEEVRGDDGRDGMGAVRAGAILPFHGPSDLEERVACLPAESETERRPECLSRSPILMASNRFEPNGMANV